MSAKRGGREGRKKGGKEGRKEEWKERGGLLHTFNQIHVTLTLTLTQTHG